MALSAEQKAANKLWQKARDRAFTARRHRMDAAENHAEQAVDAEHGGAWVAADAACKAHIEARYAAIAEFDARIAAIKAEKEAYLRKCEAGWDPLRETKRAAWEIRQTARQDAQNRIEQEFPDLTRSARFSSAVWGAQDAVKPLIDAELARLVAEAAGGGKAGKKA